MNNRRYSLKKLTLLFVCLFMVCGFLFTACYQSPRSKGALIYNQALKQENEKSFSEALQLYEQALPLLVDENETELAVKCSEALRRIEIFQETYPYTAARLEEIIKQTYPQMTADRISDLIINKKMELCIWDGEEHYFYDSAANLKYADMDLMHADAAAQQYYTDLYYRISQDAEKQPEHSWQQYQKPATYRGTHILSVPRDELPDLGTYRIWFPIPINTGSQSTAVIESITPEKWVKQPPGIDRDIGLVYMEIPMQELKEDLNIEITFTFTHFEQRFTVDPDNVGEYDVNSDLYKKYTGSYGNTAITPEIQKAAKDIVGNETNPYLAARKLYDYIVNEVDYAFMPHYVLWPRTDRPESVYVHENKRGDCGAQSIYFSALCRSLGIPARTTGGWQLFTDSFRGHFWAEFYLPNYGWVPADTSVAQLALYPYDLTAEQRRTMIDYFFGNQDSMRCVVQKDTDIPLIPQADSLALLSMAIQIPTIEYSIPNGEISENVFLEYWSMECEKIN